MTSFTPTQRKIVTLAALGGMLEFYDFIIYGIFSVYFAAQFFPSKDALWVIIQSYIVFVLGYLARPIGGLFFSHIGDEYGRKTVLIITIVLMGAASLGIGILPTYAEIGVAAPVLLLILRLMQGLALGGELPSTFVYIKETMMEKQGIAFGITMSGVNAGLLLGMIINFILNHTFTSEQLNQFGWRIPFLIGGGLCIISYYIRRSLQETLIFQKIVDKPKWPLLYLLQNHSKECMAGIALIAMMAGTVVGTIIFMPTYLTQILKVNAQQISYAMVALMLMNVTIIYFSGQLAQKYSPVLLMKLFLAISCVAIPLGYFLVYQSHLIPGLALLGTIEGMAAMLTPYLVSQLFESKIRLTGVALCYNIGFTLFGGLAPLIITHFINKGYSVYITPSVYLIVMILICAVGLNFSKTSTMNTQLVAES